MIEIHTLSPFTIRYIVSRYWEGESLPRIADSLNIDRIKLFNFKNQNTAMWNAVENSIIQSEIRSHIHTDARAKLSDKDTARVKSLLFSHARHPETRVACLTLSGLYRRKSNAVQPQRYREAARV